MKPFLPDDDHQRPSRDPETSDPFDFADLDARDPVLHADSPAADETEMYQEEEPAQLSWGDRIGSWVRENLFYGVIILGVITPALWQLYQMAVNRMNPPQERTVHSERGAESTRVLAFADAIEEATKAPPIQEIPKHPAVSSVPPATSDPTAMQPIVRQGPVPLKPGFVPGQTPVGKEPQFASAVDQPAKTPELPSDKQDDKADKKPVNPLESAPETAPAAALRAAHRPDEAAWENRLANLDKTLVRLEALEKQLATLHTLPDTVAHLQTQLRDLPARASTAPAPDPAWMNQITSQLQALKQAMAVVVTELKQQRDRQLAVADPAPSPASTARVAPTATTSWIIEAIVPGRAWLRNPEGQAYTVAVGDMLPGYGRVRTIDAPGGRIITTKGVIVQP